MSCDYIKPDTDQLKETAIGRKYIACKRDRQQPIIKGVDEVAKTARRPRHDFEEWFYLDIGKEWTRGLVGIGQPSLMREIAKHAAGDLAPSRNRLDAKRLAHSTEEHLASTATTAPAATKPARTPEPRRP